MGLGRRSRVFRAVAGHPATRRLALCHAVDDFADALITLSLVGSLFFSVSLDASRDRILLYLLLTAGPLALVAPLVGPILDRYRAGHRSVVVGSQLARAVAALLLASALLSLAFYPLVFVILLARKAYALAKTAIVAQLVGTSDDLVAASGHIARTGTIAGGVGTAAGGVLIALVGVEWLPIAAATGFAVAAIVGSGIRAPGAAPVVGAAIVRMETPPDVRRAVAAVVAIRAAAGALTFLLALSIKRGGGDGWIFAAALVAAGVGSFLGTLVASRLHRRFASQRVILFTLVVPGAVCAFGVLTIGSLSVIAIAFTIGLGGSVSSREMDALYGLVPTVVRGRVISLSELVFQLANVAGAVAAVAAFPGPRVGFAVVAAALLVSGFAYASSLRLSIRHEAGRWLLGGDHGRDAGGDHDAPLPGVLLAEAMRCAERGDHRVAVIMAESAVRVRDARSGNGNATERQASVRSDARERWSALAAFVDGVVDGTVAPTAAAVVEVIGAACEIVEPAGCDDPDDRDTRGQGADVMS